MEWALIMAEIMLINIVLSGDNAVVIAMASKNLPMKQKNQAVLWGATGAVVLRILLTLGAVFLLQIPYIQALGALLLLYIAIKLLMDDHDQESVKQAGTLGAAIGTIVMADLVMSIDNVLAIAAIAEGNLILLVVGVVLSIPVLVWGSAVIMILLQKLPLLIFLGAGILGFTSGEMFLNEVTFAEWISRAHDSIHWVIPISFTGIVLLAGILHSSFKPRS